MKEIFKGDALIIKTRAFPFFEYNYDFEAKIEKYSAGARGWNRLGYKKLFVSFCL